MRTQNGTKVDVIGTSEGLLICDHISSSVLIRLILYQKLLFVRSQILVMTMGVIYQPTELESMGLKMRRMGDTKSEIVS